MALLYGANRWEFNSWKLWPMALWAYFLHLISDWIQTSTGKENHNNKAHSSVMCHWFAKRPAGCWCPGQMKLFIRGKFPKQTADISVAVGNESEGRDGDRVGERVSPHWTYVSPCQYGWWWAVGCGRGLFCLRTHPSMSVLWPEPPSDHFLWFHSLQKRKEEFSDRHQTNVRLSQ